MLGDRSIASGGGPADARLALAQGAFFIASGLWPLVHLRSFEAVTGPKLEGWLVKTVGTLIAVIGGTLLSAGARGKVPREVALLGAGSAAALAAVDVVYAGARRRISPIYLFDAAVEAGIVALWARARLRPPPMRAIARPART